MGFSPYLNPQATGLKDGGRYFWLVASNQKAHSRTTKIMGEKIIQIIPADDWFAVFKMDDGGELGGAILSRLTASTRGAFSIRQSSRSSTTRATSRTYSTASITASLRWTRFTLI